MCKDYPEKFKYDKHPKDISLREFMKNFTKKWKSGKANIFPYFLPTYKYIVNKSSPHYEDYCKTLLLQDKPGCYFSNVGKNFESCEAELRDFVENSEFCPKLVKEDFKKSQLLPEKTRGKSDETGKTDDDPLDELLVEAGDIVPKELENEIADIFNNTVRKLVTGDDPILENGSDYGDDEIPLGEVEAIDWLEDAKELGLLDKATLNDVKGWLDYQKKSFQVTKPQVQGVDASSLNMKQKKAYDRIIEWVGKKIKDPNTPSLYLNISGRAGCGKTFWLNIVIAYIKQVVGLSFIKRGAPTATAAFMIGGETLHALLKINPKLVPEQDLPPLKGEVLRELQDIFANVELIVIDEKSMVGLHMLYMIHKRLTEIKPRKAEEPFGGVSIVFMGDFAQLPPVGDKPMYYTDPKDLSPYQVKGVELFKLFDNTIIFDEIMRQKGDSQQRFRECLEKLSNGSFDRTDWEYLGKRSFFSLKPEEQDDFMKNAVMVCSTNLDTKSHNMARMRKLGTPLIPIRSVNNCADAARAHSKKSGLQQQIVLAKNCEVVLTTNLWKETGLTNGATGTVKYLVYEKGTKPPSLPFLVFVQFHNYTGPSYLDGIERCVPIAQILRTWPGDGGKTFSRTMLPLIPGYSKTIHKCQGETMEKLLMNLGQKEFAPGLSYVALSRCKKVENIAFYPKIPNLIRFTSIKAHKVSKLRHKQDEKEMKSDAK